MVAAAVADGVITEEEHEGILWLCDRLTSPDFIAQRSHDLQRLHAILGGIASDGVIREAELMGLSTWLQNHEDLRTCWPYDEIDSLITGIMRDQRIDEREHRLLQQFMAEFVETPDRRTVANPPVAIGNSIVGLCAACPSIEFAGSTF